MADDRAERAPGVSAPGIHGASEVRPAGAPADDLLAPEVVADPYPYFARLREEDPVHWNERSRAWLLTRYGDIVAALRDPRLSADRVSEYFTAGLGPQDRVLMTPAFEVLARWMVFRDPPDHTRLRGLVRQAFTVRAIEMLRPRIQQVVDELLDGLQEAGRADLVARFAQPLPAIVIAGMLGVPATDLDLFTGWSAELSSILFGALDQRDRYHRGHQALFELIEYFERLIERHRVHPTSPLVTALIEAEERGEVLRREEVVATCILLLFAGHETTTDLLGNAVLALLRHPDQRRMLERDPSLARQAVEEFLRYDGTAKVTIRSVRVGLEVRGRRLEPGQRVLLALASANRDPERFTDPDRLDIARRENRHLGFGSGIHYCLGAPLARLEAEIAITSLLRRFPRLRLVGEPPEWLPVALSRSLRSLPVSVG
jgi:cytochrome P450